MNITLVISKPPRRHRPPECLEKAYTNNLPRLPLFSQFSPPVIPYAVTGGRRPSTRFRDEFRRFDGGHDSESRSSSCERGPGTRRAAAGIASYIKTIYPGAVCVFESRTWRRVSVYIRRWQTNVKNIHEPTAVPPGSSPGKPFVAGELGTRAINIVFVWTPSTVARV